MQLPSLAPSGCKFNSGLPAASSATLPPSGRNVATHATLACTLLALSALAGCASLADGEAMQTASAAAKDTGVTVFAAGDIADCRKVRAADSGAARTAALIVGGIAADPAAVVLALGDTAYPVGLPAEFNDCYAPTWGQFKSRTLPAPGNHEYYTAGAPGYFGYFGAAAGPDRRGYYSTDVGAWHVVSLNSNLEATQADAQLAWLSEDLAALRRRDPAACILAFWHHPLYSSGGHGNNLQMRGVWQALMAARTDLVLTAHDHDYERFAPQDAASNADAAAGIRSFVVGNGGARLTPFTATKANSLAQDNATHGVLKLILRPRDYEWAFLPVDGTAARDVGGASCHTR